MWILLKVNMKLYNRGLQSSCFLFHHLTLLFQCTQKLTVTLLIDLSLLLQITSFFSQTPQHCFQLFDFPQYTIFSQINQITKSYFGFLCRTTKLRPCLQASCLFKDWGGSWKQFMYSVRAKRQLCFGCVCSLMRTQKGFLLKGSRKIAMKKRGLFERRGWDVMKRNSHLFQPIIIIIKVLNFLNLNKRFQKFVIRQNLTSLLYILSTISPSQISCQNIRLKIKLFCFYPQYILNVILYYQLMQLSLVLKHLLNRTARQAKFWKPKTYEAIPHYVKPHFIDIHDTYTPRTHEQVLKELKGKEFEVQVERVVYKSTDISKEIKGRKAILLAHMDQFELTELQLARFKVLVGCRYNDQTKWLKLTCELFPDYLQNHTKIHEMFHDIIMETKRAP